MLTSVRRIIAVQVLMHKPPHGRSLGRLRSTHLVRVLVHVLRAIPTTTAIQLITAAQQSRLSAGPKHKGSAALPWQWHQRMRACPCCPTIHNFEDPAIAVMARKQLGFINIFAKLPENDKDL